MPLGGAWFMQISPETMRIKNSHQTSLPYALMVLPSLVMKDLQEERQGQMTPRNQL